MVSNKDKAQATYEGIQAMKNNKVLSSLEVAKLARKKDKEITEYSISNSKRIKRRMR